MDAHEQGKREKIKIRVKKKKPFKLQAKPIILGCLVLVMVIFAAYFAYEIWSLKPAAKWQEVSAKEGVYIQLPKDDAPHNTPMEWWYYNGHLKTASGKKYSFHYTVFLVNGLIPHNVSHVSLADHQLQKNYTTEKRTAGGGSDSVGQGKFLFNHSGWLMSGVNGTDQLKANSDQFAFDLKLETSQPPILHGNNGIINMKNAGDSFYYSRSRLNVSGTLKIHGNTEKVTGTAWFDHQWGDLRITSITWNWFSLMLDNGTDIMIYQFYDNTGKQLLNTGTLTKDGITEVLPDTGIHLSPLETWTSKISGLVYPVRWRLELPSKHINLTTRAIVNNSEFDARLTTYNIYWEGAVNVTGSQTGQGFVEMNQFKH
jgi:predicted secreted hydrolase